MLSCWTACAHAPPQGSLDTLKPVVETFHLRIRWKDFGGASDLIVPERREQFEKACRARHDERDLSVTDFELEEAKLAADGQSAVVVSRLSWLRLPSVTVSTATVTSHFVYRDKRWWLARQEDGPFSAELGGP